MDNQIPNIPDINNYTEIKDAVNTKKLAVFIGAGVSRIIGCKGWDQLAKELIEMCYTTEKDGKRLIDKNYKDVLLKDNDHKKQISITYDIFERDNFEEIFYQTMYNALKCNPDKKKKFNIYKEIYGLRGFYITTNADKHMHEFFQSDRVRFRDEHFDSHDINTNYLYHIHGLEGYEDSLVFTASSYLKRYHRSTKNEKFFEFLTKIFSNYVVLFVGYGLSEFEILNNILPEYKSRSIFSLMPYEKSDVRYKYEKSYYDKINITIIPYSISENSYEQLYFVLQNWSKEINKLSSYTYDSIQELEKLMEEH